MKKNIVRVGRYKLRTIHVHAYTWFDKTYGNPYFAVRITINWNMPSEKEIIIPMQYGSDPTYAAVQEVWNYLGRSEYITPIKLSDYGIRVYSTKSKVSYKELKAIR